MCRARSRRQERSSRNAPLSGPKHAASARLARHAREGISYPLKNVMKAKAQMFGDVTLEQALELGLFVCGSPATVLDHFKAYWSELRFGNLLVMCQFGTLPAHLTRKNLELFAREVMPALKALG